MELCAGLPSLTSGDLFIIRANFGGEVIRASYRVPLVKLYLFDMVSDISPVVVGFGGKSQGKRNSREGISNLERELQISSQLASDEYPLGAPRGNLGYPTNRFYRIWFWSGCCLVHIPICGN